MIRIKQLKPNQESDTAASSNLDDILDDFTEEGVQMDIQLFCSTRSWKSTKSKKIAQQYSGDASH